MVIDRHFLNVEFRDTFLPDPGMDLDGYKLTEVGKRCSIPLNILTMIRVGVPHEGNAQSDARLQFRLQVLLRRQEA